MDQSIIESPLYEDSLTEEWLNNEKVTVHFFLFFNIISLQLYTLGPTSFQFLQTTQKIIWEVPQNTLCNLQSPLHLSEIAFNQAIFLSLETENNRREPNQVNMADKAINRNAIRLILLQQ